MISSADTLKDPTMLLATIGFWAFIKDMGDGDFDAGILSMDHPVTPEQQRQRADKVLHAELAAVKHLSQYHGLSMTRAGNLINDVQRGLHADPLSMGINFVLRAAWYHYGMPVITMGHRLAASYMCTKMPAEVVDEIREPFSAFLLEIPDNLLLFDDNGKAVSARCALVGRLPDSVRGSAWSYCAYTDGISTLWRKHWKLSEFTKQHMENEQNATSAFGVEITDLDSRSVELLGRLISSAMLHMTQEHQVVKVGKGHGAYKGPGRAGVEPSRRVFQLRHDLKHDMREAVRSYVRGDGDTSINVQLMVSGHWKRVVHGEARSLRRRQFIEPYWRGPEDAPIAMRKHVLQDVPASP